MKMKKYVYILLMTLGSIGMYSCENVLSEEVLSWNKEEGCYANLTISMNVPSLNVESRTLASDPKNQGDSWTNWEKFVDGALLYRVTLFVIDKNDKLVAYRNFYSESPDIKAETEPEGGNGFYEGYTKDALWSGTVNTTAKTGVAVKATFKASSPLHGDMERLKPGDYTIIAVANYSPIVASANNGLLNTTLGLDATQTYSGLGNVSEDGDAETGIANNNGTGGDFTSLVNGLTTDVMTDDNEFAGVDDVFSKPLFAYQLNSGADRVCKQLPQPLVMIRKKSLVAGNNQLEGMLSRTFARVRLEVKNNDKSSLIGVSGLSFQNNYASQNAYLFNDVAAGNANLYDHFALYDSTKGKIGVTSADAITPASEDMKRLPAGSSYTMLDCYILEGMISATYAFQFTATHWTSGNNEGTTANYMITSFYKGESSGSSGPGGGGSGEYGLLDFMVYIRDSSGDSSKYLLGSETVSQYSQSGTVETTYISELAQGYVIEPKYVWEIQLSTTPTYSSQRGVANGTLQSIASGLYLQAYDGSDDMTPKLGDQQSEVIFKINFSGQVENGTVFCLYDGSYYYLDSDDSHELKWVPYKGTSITTSSSSNSYEYEYLAFETIPGEAGKAESIEIQKAIGATTEGTTQTNEIVRNDFYYGIVPISISESSVANSSNNE